MLLFRRAHYILALNTGLLPDGASIKIGPEPLDRRTAMGSALLAFSLTIGVDYASHELWEAPLFAQAVTKIDEIVLRQRGARLNLNEKTSLAEALEEYPHYII